MLRFLLPLVLLACHPSGDETVQLEPNSGSMSGYYDLRVETELEVTDVRLGGIRAFDLRPESGALVFTVQGHPESGPVDLELFTGTKSEIYADAFTYEPVTEGFETVVAIGASLSQGVQGGVPTQHGQRNSPSRFVAQQAGAFHPAPLLIPDLFPRITGEHISPAPECREPNIVDHITNAAIDVLVKLNDEENNRIGFYMGLEDPELQPYNLAVGNSGVSTILNGPNPDDFAEEFLARFVFDPDGGINDPVLGSELELAEALHPTVILCSDTYGNDLLGWRPLDDVRPDMVELLDRLAATDAQVFLANIPRLTLLPGAGSNEERDALADAYREAFADEAARHDNIHVVDFYAAVEADALTGIPVAGRTLTLAAYDGLLSTDGLHLSDVGYAYQANLFIKTINEVMGVDLALVDLDEVYPTDLHRPEALLEQGIDPDCLAQ